MGLRRILISGELIASVFTKGINASMPVNTPKDAKFVRSIRTQDSQTFTKDNTLEIVMESADWEGPENGEIIPIFTPEFRKSDARG